MAIPSNSIRSSFRSPRSLTLAALAIAVCGGGSGGVAHAEEATVAATPAPAATTTPAAESTLLNMDTGLTFRPTLPTEPEPAPSPDTLTAPTITTTPPPAPAPAATADTDADGRSTAYGTAGSRWWTVTLAGASNFDNFNDASIAGAWSQFLADDFEFAIEAALWYFNQSENDHGDGLDTGGVSGSMIFRWHFAQADDYSWSIFADAGIGLLGSFSNIPEGGTGLNFIPRLGMGATIDLDSDDGADHGARLMLGLRWQHISNGRIEGDSNNPAFDGLCAYVGLVFPF